MAPADVVELPDRAERVARTADDMQRVVALGLWLLSARSYQWASLALMAGGFGFTLYEPSALRLLTACLFTLCSQVPVWLHATKERTT